MSDNPTFNIIKQEKQIKTREELAIEAYLAILEANKTGDTKKIIEARKTFIGTARADIPQSKLDKNKDLETLRPDRRQVRKEVLSQFKFIYDQEARAYDYYIDQEIERRYLAALHMETMKVYDLLAESTNWNFFKQVKGAEIK
jgi:hypothetical protein